MRCISPRRRTHREKDRSLVRFARERIRLKPSSFESLFRWMESREFHELREATQSPRAFILSSDDERFERVSERIRHKLQEIFSKFSGFIVQAKPA